MVKSSYVCYQCGAPAVNFACYGRNPQWIEASCAEHSLPLTHWADPYASSGPLASTPEQAVRKADFSESEKIAQVCK